MRRITKLLIGMMLIGPITPCAAMSFTEIFNDVRDNTRFKILTEGQPSYFYNVKDNINAAAFTMPLSAYRDIVSLDVGWTGGYDDKTVGTVLAGGQFHVDALLPLLAPDTLNTIKAMLPEAVRSRTDNIRAGFMSGYNFSENNWVWGLIAGYAFGD